MNKSDYNEALRLYKEGKTVRDISKLIKIPVTTTWRLLNQKKQTTTRTNFDYRKSYRTYEIDENLFSKIDTPNKAYFLGIMYADGNIHSRSHQIKLKLQEKDKQILDDIKLSFNISQKLHFIKSNNIKVQNQYSLVIVNKVMHGDLIRHGVRPNKTFKLSFPFGLDSDLYSHFVRGYFDGDGCISYDDARGSSTVSICGTQQMCEDLQWLFDRNIGIKSFTSPDRNIFRVRIRRYRDVKRFQDWIYQDADLKLGRKWLKFKYINEVKNDGNV